MVKISRRVRDFAGIHGEGLLSRRGGRAKKQKMNKVTVEEVYRLWSDMCQLEFIPEMLRQMGCSDLCDLNLNSTGLSGRRSFMEISVEHNEILPTRRIPSGAGRALFAPALGKILSRVWQDACASPCSS